MISVGVVGLGKMGISHLATFQAHPDVELAGVADTSGYALDVLAKYTGVRTFPRMDALLDGAALDAVVIATPSHLHGQMVRTALDRGLHVFCEKPFSLDVGDGASLAELAESRGLVTQVGYHNRFVAAFAEAKRLLDLGAVGSVSHVLAEAYGPVVLKAKGGTWRSRRAAGGGCLYDYAAHPVDLLHWYFGGLESVSGSVLTKIFSKETEDEVLSTLHFLSGSTAQLSVSWSDESHRKMSTQITIWGSGGRIVVDRQEIKVYLRSGGLIPRGYRVGWNVRYTTDMTEAVWYYLRGEEYSAQVDEFVKRVHVGQTSGLNSFADAVETDRTLAMIAANAEHAPTEPTAQSPAATQRPRRRRIGLPRLRRPHPVEVR